MLIWRGWGILSPIIAAAPVVVVNGSKMGNIVAGVGLVLAALLNWFLGQWFNRPLREADFDFGRRHSFFWIPMEWWSVAMLFFSAVNLLGLKL